MKKLNGFLHRIPALLSSKPSIFIYLFLFFYLVVYALVSTFVPWLDGPSDSTQLIMGNYTNVLSALGASLAAGSGVAAHSSLQKLHKRHDELQDAIKELQDALEKLQESKGET